MPYSKKILKNLDSLTDFLPHIKRMDDEEGEVCFGGKVFYGKIEFPLKIRIKPNQFLYIQSVNVHEKEETLKAIEFYIATLNHFLMKEISWN